MERRAGDGSAVVSSSGISGCDSSTLLMAVPRAKVASEEDEECEEAAGPGRERSVVSHLKVLRGIVFDSRR